MNQNYFISKKVLVEGKPLVGLNAREYENPTDSAALSALKLNKGFDTIFKKFIEYRFERAILLRHKASCFLVTKDNMPYLIDCLEKACKILDIKKVPELYIQPDESLNAATLGTQNPIIVLNSGLLHSLNHEELMYIIGHELGHIKSEHVQYKMVAQYYFSAIKKFADASLIAQLVATGLEIAFYSWMRCAELTADRAGLLVCQHLPAAITAEAKCCGCPIDIYDQLDANMFLKQVAAFDGFENSFYNKFIEITETLYDSHPMGVLRAKELMLWVQSGEYAKILLRNSTWTEKELARLAQTTQDALQKRDDLHNKATDVVAKSADADADLETAKQTTSAQQGLKRVAAWGSEVIKGAKAKNSKKTVAKTDKKVLQADEAYQKALAAETALRATFKTPSQAEIDALTKEVLGDLINIKEIVQQ